MSAITTHVLDTARGCPAAGLYVRLEAQGGAGGWTPLGAGVTDADGRLRMLLATRAPLVPGTYRLVFDTPARVAAPGVAGVYPGGQGGFAGPGAGAHPHLPPLLRPLG